jgi:hypothetical protein
VDLPAAARALQAASAHGASREFITRNQSLPGLLVWVCNLVPDHRVTTSSIGSSTSSSSTGSSSTGSSSTGSISTGSSSTGSSSTGSSSTGSIVTGSNDDTIGSSATGSTWGSTGIVIQLQPATTPH